MTKKTNYDTILKRIIEHSRTKKGCRYNSKANTVCILNILEEYSDDKTLFTLNVYGTAETNRDGRWLILINVKLFDHKRSESGYLKN